MNCKDEFTVPDDAGKVEYVFEVGKTDIILYKKRDAAVEDEENAAREAARAADELAHEQFSSTTKFMYELRRDFVKDLTPAECKKHFSAIMEYATPLLSGYGRVRDDENVLHLLGVALDEQVQDDTELEDTLKMFNAYDTEPEKVLLAMPLMHRTASARVIGAPSGAAKRARACISTTKTSPSIVPMSS